MDINLEKIEIVKDRTGSTYAQAKDALERNDGSVVDAIIDIEESLNKEFEAVNNGSFKDSPIFSKAKEIIEKGNVSKLLVVKDGKTVASFPVTVGVIGAVLVPWGAVVAAVAAVGTKCEIQFVNDKGDVTDINGTVVGIYDKAKDAVKNTDLSKVEDAAYRTSDKIQELGSKGAEKVNEAWDKISENETVEDVKDTFEKGTAKLMDLWDKLEKSGKIDEVKDAVEKVTKKAVDTAKNFANDASDKTSSDAEEETGAAVDVEDVEVSSDESTEE